MTSRIENAATLTVESCLLSDSRQTGKRPLLWTLFQSVPTYELRSSRQFCRLSADPGVFRSGRTRLAHLISENDRKTLFF